jgi:SAM-dependent methyltransferase
MAKRRRAKVSRAVSKTGAGVKTDARTSARNGAHGRRASNRKQLLSTIRSPPQHAAGICTRAFLREKFYRYCIHSPLSIISAPSRALLKSRVQKMKERERASPHHDKERRLAARYCKGRGIDVGCGSNKTVPTAIGIDLTPKGSYGDAGNQLFEQSQADVVTSGDDLRMFNDGELDYVVARHNLEHYQDTVKTLLEWRRVLKPGGYLILVLPDDAALNTIALDPTHYHVFTRESTARLLIAIGGFSILKNDVAIPNWSFIVVARRL